MARQFVGPESPNYFDLEDPVSLARLDEPATALGPLEGTVVIDEVQLRPELFPVLRVLIDRPSANARFLILGSASGNLLRQTSESLAGRIERISMGGFTLSEVGVEQREHLWLRGGFPDSFLADGKDDSFAWRENFIQTLLERDFPNWGIRIAATTLRRFWSMLAHYHGQTWSAGEPARAMGVSEPTVRSYLDLLTDAFMIRQLQPLYANLKKRQVKSPKIYLRDSGLLHSLLGVRSHQELLRHPKVGASWEGFVIRQLLSARPHDESFFWATHQGAEIDLVLRVGGDLHGYEIKRADAPKMTPSIRNAIAALDLQSVTVIYPGDRAYSLSENVTVIPFAHLGAAPE